jgi:hypothetical protein
MHMPSKHNHALLEDLALHVATGQKISPWARDHGIHERTVRNWSNRPEFQELVRQHRLVIIDRVLGQTVGLAERAMGKLGHLMENAKQEATQARAAEFISTHLMTIASFAEFERRLSLLEKLQNAPPNGTDRTTEEA